MSVIFPCTECTTPLPLENSPPAVLLALFCFFLKKTITLITSQHLLSFHNKILHFSPNLCPLTPIKAVASFRSQTTPKTFIPNILACFISDLFDQIKAMMKQHFISLSFLLLFLLHCTTTTPAQSPAQAPSTGGVAQSPSPSAAQTLAQSPALPLVQAPSQVTLLKPLPKFP